MMVREKQQTEKEANMDGNVEMVVGMIV